MPSFGKLSLSLFWGFLAEYELVRNSGLQGIFVCDKGRGIGFYKRKLFVNCDTDPEVRFFSKFRGFCCNRPAMNFLGPLNSVLGGPDGRALREFWKFV